MIQNSKLRAILILLIVLVILIVFRSVFFSNSQPSTGSSAGLTVEQRSYIKGSLKTLPPWLSVEQQSYLDQMAARGPASFTPEQQAFINSKLKK
jgi:hypothetical protein